MVDARWILMSWMPYYANRREIDGKMVWICRWCFRPISETPGPKTRKYCDKNCREAYWHKWGWQWVCGDVFRRDRFRCVGCNKQLGTEKGRYIDVSEDYQIHHILTVDWMPRIVGSAIRPRYDSIQQLRTFISKWEAGYPAVTLGTHPSEILDGIMTRAAINYLGEKDRFNLILKEALLDKSNLVTMCTKCHHKSYVHCLPSPFKSQDNRLLDIEWGHREKQTELTLFGGLIDYRFSQHYDYLRWRHAVPQIREGLWQSFLKLNFPKYKATNLFSFMGKSDTIF